MFSVSFKNPLEAETVGERRERKSKESEGSIRSQRSASRAKLLDRSLISKKVSLFGFSKGATTGTEAPDVVEKLRAPAKEDVIVAPSELAGSPVVLPVASHPLPTRPYTRTLSELSISPSISRREAVNAPTHRSTSSPRLISQEHHRCVQDDGHYAFARPDGQHECQSPVDSTGLASPIHLSRNHSGHLAKHSAERPLVERYPSTLSTSTAAQSDTWSTARSATVSTPNSSPEPLVNLNALKFPFSGESQHLANIIASTTSVSAEHTDGLDAKNEPIILAPISPREGNLRSFLTLTQNAPAKVICQRLSEDWEGSFPDLASAIDFEKKLWALQGLSRLGDLSERKQILQNDSEHRNEAKDGVSVRAGQKTGTVVHISEDGVEAWLQAATSPSQKIAWIHSAYGSISTRRSSSSPRIDTRCWTDIPILPYEDSSVDLISSRSIPILLRSSQWPVFVLECARVLRPGGTLEVTVLDPIPRKCGPLLRQWTTEKIVLGLERRFLVTHPAMIIPLWLDDITEFGHRESRTVRFPAAPDQPHNNARDPSVERFQLSDNGDQTEQDFLELRTAVGRHFYEALYGNIVGPQRSTSNERDSAEEPPRSRWWWNDPVIVKECRDRETTFEMVTYRCQKSKI